MYMYIMYNFCIYDNFNSRLLNYWLAIIYLNHIQAMITQETKVSMSRIHSNHLQATPSIH